MKKIGAVAIALCLVFGLVFVKTDKSYAGGAWNRPVTVQRASSGGCDWITYIAIWYGIEWCVAHYGYYPACFAYSC